MTEKYQVVWKVAGKWVRDEKVFASEKEAHTYAGIEQTQFEAEKVEEYIVCRFWTPKKARIPRRRK